MYGVHIRGQRVTFLRRKFGRTHRILCARTKGRAQAPV